MICYVLFELCSSLLVSIECLRIIITFCCIMLGCLVGFTFVGSNHGLLCAIKCCIDPGICRRMLSGMCIGIEFTFMSYFDCLYRKMD